MTKPTRIEEIRARAEAATPGHWGVHYDGKGTYTIEVQPRLIPGAGNVREGVVATLHGDHDDAQPYRDSGFIARAREDVPFLLGRVAELEALVKDHAAPDSTEDVHTYFGLSYANYLVLPRTHLQSMPEGWQTRFVALLNQFHDAFEHVAQASTYQVTAGKTLPLDEMTESQLHAAGIDMEGDSEDGPGPETRYHRRSDGAGLTGQDYGFVPGEDPVPHYNRGRTRVEPRLGGAA
jgi:hypothetical protein